jgi:hypothetical protein
MWNAKLYANGCSILLIKIDEVSYEPDGNSEPGYDQPINVLTTSVSGAPFIKYDLNSSPIDALEIKTVVPSALMISSSSNIPPQLYTLLNLGKFVVNS